MAFYKLLLKLIVLPIGNFLYGGYYLRNLRNWKEYDSFSENELNDIQHRNLSKLMDHAVKTVPFYMSLQASSILDFPILTKDILRNHTKDLISNNYHIGKLDKHHSSGSTGVQSFTYMSKKHTFYLRALQTHWWNWSGYEIGDNILQFGIAQQRTILKKLKDFFYLVNYRKAFGLSRSHLEIILKKISNKNKIYIAGYPSVINELSLTEVDLQLKPKIKGIICFGDKLFNHYKDNFCRAFGNSVNIIETYGCAEGILMACKKDLDFYYVMSPHVFIEIVDDNGHAVKDGEMGHVLVTCLTNMAMPLIRYKLGDLAIKLPKHQYPKNRSLKYPLLKKIVGRETDLIKTKNGTMLNVHSFTGVLEYYQEIKQYKVKQDNLESITIEYIPDKNFEITILEDIKSKLNFLTESSLKIHFVEVAFIVPSKSGKPQIIESNLKNL